MGKSFLFVWRPDFTIRIRCTRRVSWGKTFSLKDWNSHFVSTLSLWKRFFPGLNSVVIQYAIFCSISKIHSKGKESTFPIFINFSYWFISLKLIPVNWSIRIAYVVLDRISEKANRFIFVHQINEKCGETFGALKSIIPLFVNSLIPSIIILTGRYWASTIKF